MSKIRKVIVKNLYVIISEYVDKYFEHIIFGCYIFIWLSENIMVHHLIKNTSFQKEVTNRIIENYIMILLSILNYICFILKPFGIYNNGYFETWNMFGFFINSIVEGFYSYFIHFGINHSINDDIIPGYLIIYYLSNMIRIMINYSMLGISLIFIITYIFVNLFKLLKTGIKYCLESIKIEYTETLPLYVTEK